MRLTCFLLALLLPPAILAGTSQEARALFKELSEIAHRGELASNQARLAQLEAYPLYPYLLAADLRARLRQQPGRGLDAEIAAFVDEHPDLPPAQGLRAAWLKSLGERQRWSLLQARVTDDDGTTLQCLATTATIRTQSADRANLIERGLTFWHHGHSQPEACNPVFAWLEANDALTDEHIIERARLAVLENQHNLAEYLARKLPDEARAPIRRWLNVARNPGDLHTVSDLRADIAVHAFKSLAHRDLDGAAALVPDLAERLDLDDQAAYEMRRYVALLYAQNHRSEALEWFESLDDSRMDDFAHAWEVRAALLQQNWDAVLATIDAMPAEQAGEEAWRYWRGRALDANGERDAAHRIFRELAGERSYHGYLAADRLKQSYQLNRRSLGTDDNTRTALATHPAFRRARELLALDRRTDARREWYAAIEDMPKPRLQQAALLARDWGWHPMSIITLARSDYWDDLSVRYPLHYRNSAVKQAHRNDLDPAYVLAVMRTESLFMPTVRSSAGAIGLMQLMPGTARRVAADLDMPRPDTAALKTPATNIRLGSRYLRTMLDRFDNHLALASGAYNAGPNRIERWLPEETMAADIWIENIPYTETREYVQRVMAHMTIFQARLDNKIVPLAERLSPVPAAGSM